MHSTKFSTSVLVVTVTVSWSEIRRVCPACSVTGTVMTTRPRSCLGGSASTDWSVGSTVRSGFENPDTSPAPAGGAENPTAEASSATAADTAAIRPATDRAHTIPDLTNIPRPSSPPGLTASGAAEAAPAAHTPLGAAMQVPDTTELGAAPDRGGVHGPGPFRA